MSHEPGRGTSGSGRLAPDPRLRWILAAWGVIAIGVSVAAQIAVPAHGNTVVAWLVTVAVPALMVALLIVNRGDRLFLLVVAAVLIDVEALLLASLYVVGMAIAALLPIIAIDLLEPHVRGRARLTMYLASAVVATTSVALAEMGVPANPLGADHPVLAIVAVGLVAAFALGLTWRAGERVRVALASAEREIDARTVAERRLVQTARTLENLVASSPVATFALDADGKVSVWNPAAERLFGWQASEVIGHGLPFAAAAPGTVGLREQVERSLASEAPETGTVDGAARDGHGVIVEVHAARRYDGDGRARGAIFQVIDVTEREALESQLRQAQKMEAIGKLAGGVAHDFNNLLTAIRGYAELAYESLAEGDPRRDDLEQVVAGADRAGELTGQLLAFSRQQVLVPRVVDPASVVLGVSPMLQRLLGEDIDLRVEETCGRCRVRVDRSQLEQVIVNLAVNARDAMPSGGRLTVSIEPVDVDETDAAAHAEARPGSYVLIAVSDTGAGMDAETRGHAFEPFFTTKELGKGTGMGLATVYGIVTQSGGFVDLESEPGAGTTFRIYLPRAAAVPVEEERDPEPESPTGTETLLLVEDDEAVRGFARRTLESLGYAVLEAENGVRALSLMDGSDSSVRLVVTDMVMPGMHGRELAERLRRARPDLPVLFVSGFPEDWIEQGTGIDPDARFLPKPFSAPALAQAVRDAIDAPLPGDLRDPKPGPSWTSNRPDRDAQSGRGESRAASAADGRQ